MIADSRAIGPAIGCARDHGLKIADVNLVGLEPGDALCFRAEGTDVAARVGVGATADVAAREDLAGASHMGRLAGVLVATVGVGVAELTEGHAATCVAAALEA